MARTKGSSKSVILKSNFQSDIIEPYLFTMCNFLVNQIQTQINNEFEGRELSGNLRQTIKARNAYLGNGDVLVKGQVRIPAKSYDLDIYRETKAVVYTPENGSYAMTLNNYGFIIKDNLSNSYIMANERHMGYIRRVIVNSCNAFRSVFSAKNVQGSNSEDKKEYAQLIGRNINYSYYVESVEIKYPKNSSINRVASIIKKQSDEYEWQKRKRYYENYKDKYVKQNMGQWTYTYKQPKLKRKNYGYYYQSKRVPYYSQQALKSAKTRLKNQGWSKSTIYRRLNKMKAQNKLINKKVFLGYNKKDLKRSLNSINYRSTINYANKGKKNSKINTWW